MTQSATISILLAMLCSACGAPEPEPADAPSKPAVQSTAPEAQGQAGPAQEEGPPDRGVTTDGYDLQDRPRIELTVVVDMQPAPETSGGHVFLAGFDDLNPRTQMPIRGSQPQDYKTLAMFVQGWPATAEVKLITGMHYFVMYGFNEWPSPGDRMSTFIEITEETQGPLKYTIESMSTPKDEDGPTPRPTRTPPGDNPPPQGPQ